MWTLGTKWNFKHTLQLEKLKSQSALDKSISCFQTASKLEKNYHSFKWNLIYFYTFKWLNYLIIFITPVGVVYDAEKTCPTAWGTYTASSKVSIMGTFHFKKRYDKLDGGGTET